MTQSRIHRRRPGRKGLVQGFTLIELLMVLVIGSILLGSAVPALTRWVDERAMDQQVTALRSALRLAREEAVRRGELVSVCARQAGDGDASMVCTPQGNDWSNGWLVFVDRGERGVLEAGDHLVAVEQVGPGQTTMAASLHHVSFQQTGISVNAASNFRLYGRHAVDGAASRLLCLSKTGRLRVGTGQVCG